MNGRGRTLSSFTTPALGASRYGWLSVSGAEAGKFLIMAVMARRRTFFYLMGGQTGVGLMTLYVKLTT